MAARSEPVAPGIPDHAMLDALYGNAPYSVAIYDADGRVTAVNGAYERMWNVRAAEVPASYSLFSDPQLADAGALPLLRRAFAGEPLALPPVRYDAGRITGGGGTARWACAYCHPVRTSAGAVTHVAIVHTDVTPLLDSEAAWAALNARLDDERETLARIIEQLPAALAVLDGPELRFRAVSGAYARMVGDRALVGRAFGDAMPDLAAVGQPVDFVAALMRTYTEGIPFVGTDLHARWDADGDGEAEEHFVDLVFAPLFGRADADAGARIEGVTVLVQDVSERVRIERALRESEKRFRNMANAAPVMLWVTEADGGCTFLNRQWLEFTGQSLMEGRGEGRFDAVHPEDRAAIVRTFTESNAQQMPFRVDYRLRTRAGDYRWVSDSAAPRWGTTGEYLGYIGSVVDIEERTQLLESTRESRTVAEHVADRARRLQQVTAALNRAITREQIADVIFDSAMRAVGADAGSIALVRHDAHGRPVSFETLRSEGYREEMRARYERFPVVRGRPLSEAVLQQRILLVSSPAEWRRQFPAVEPDLTDVGFGAFVALPVVVGDVVMAALSFSFTEPRPFDDHTRTFLATLAEQCALALERQRLHERELRQSAQNAALLETIEDAFIACDAELRLTYVNARGEALLQGEARALRGRALFDVLPDARHSPLGDAVERVLATRRSAQVEVYDPARQRWLDARLYPAPDGVSLVCQDITERKRAQSASAFLAEASRLLSESLDYPATLRAVADLAVPRLGDWCAVSMVEEPTLQEWPPRVERVAFVHRDPAKLAIGEEVQRRFPTDWADDRGLAGVLRTGHPLLIPRITPEMLAQGARDDEHLRLLLALEFSSILMVPLIARGLTLGALTLCMTESRRTYDDADLALAQDLAQRAAVAVDNARLFRAAERARAEAESANVAKSQFLATMSHELRTPLNAIQGHTQLLDLGLHGPVTDAQRDALARIERAQRHLLGLIDDVLSYARLEGGKVEYHLRAVRVESVLRDILPLVERQYAAKGVALVLPSTDGAPALLVDRDKLGQILLNLLTNAAKFTPTGGRVEVVVEHEPAQDTEQARLLVRDTGIGIPQEKLEAIFQPFVQVRSAYEPGSGGTGLGLAISRDLARGMSGDLRATSRPGHGACFILTLPIA